MKPHRFKRYRDKAREIYAPLSGEGGIEVSIDATIQENRKGAYVQAWVWVNRDEIEDAPK